MMKRASGWILPAAHAVAVLWLASCQRGSEVGQANEEAGKLTALEGGGANPGWVNPTSVYSCSDPNGGSFVLTTTTLNMNPGELAFWLPPRFNRPYEVLAREEGSFGKQYKAEGILFSVLEGSAVLSVDGQEFSDCSLDRRTSVWEHAKLSGVDFRATGNEPGWHLEIRHDLETSSGKRIRFVYDYGERDIVLHAPDPTVDQGSGRTTYNGVNGDLTIVVELLGEPCQDSMSGEEFETTVRVEFQGRAYLGCGRALH
jgi:uncharacterized membrane protein